MASRRRLGEMRLQLISTRVAQHAKDRDFKSYMRSLEPKAGRRPGELPADALLRQLKETGLWASLKR